MTIGSSSVEHGRSGIVDGENRTSKIGSIPGVGTVVKDVQLEGSGGSVVPPFRLELDSVFTS